MMILLLEIKFIHWLGILLYKNCIYHHYSMNDGASTRELKTISIFKYYGKRKTRGNYFSERLISI